jgi:hypothetical protein
MPGWSTRILPVALVLAIGRGPKFYKPGATEKDFAQAAAPASAA